MNDGELKAFLEKRQSRHKAKCQPHEFYCLRCRAPRLAWGGLVDAVQLSVIRYNLTAFCGVCEGSVHRLISARQLSEFQKRFALQEQRQENIWDS
jgi:transcription elongation factor Elf1